MVIQVSSVAVHSFAEPYAVDDSWVEFDEPSPLPPAPVGDGWVELVPSPPASTQTPNPVATAISRLVRDGVGDFRRDRLAGFVDEPIADEDAAISLGILHLIVDQTDEDD